jgi:hypothetical protein
MEQSINGRTDGSVVDAAQIHPGQFDPKIKLPPSCENKDLMSPIEQDN